MKKALFTTIGFFLFITGMMALVLSLVGVKLSFLTWIDHPSRLFGFIVRLLMIVGGAVTIVLARVDWQEERLESE